MVKKKRLTAYFWETDCICDHYYHSYASFPTSGVRFSFIAAPSAYIGVSIGRSWAGSQNKRAEPLLFLVLLRWATKGSQSVPKKWSYTRRPLIGRRNRHLRKKGIKTYKHSAREVFLDNGESFVCLIEENVVPKFSRPSWTSSIVAPCLICRVHLFHWIY